MAVIIIGSTGNGKSALGNFLLNPDEEHLYSKLYFQRARDNKPCTQETKVAGERVSSSSLKQSRLLTVIDTPGLNESHRKDLQHMIGLVETLVTVNTIHACLVVLKFDGKIDTQYKNTIRYYSRLLPALFEKNLVIVMTGFDSSEKAKRARRRDGIDVERIVINTQREIGKLCDFSSEPQLFKIDCLPDEEDLDVNLKERDGILQYMFSRRPVRMTEFKIPKPDFLQILDDKEVITLEQQIIRSRIELSEDKKALQEVVKELKQGVGEFRHLFSSEMKYSLRIRKHSDLIQEKEKKKVKLALKHLSINEAKERLKEI